MSRVDVSSSSYRDRIIIRKVEKYVAKCPKLSSSRLQRLQYTHLSAASR